MNKELGMTREEAWRLMKAYRTGLPWTAEHIIALRLLIDEDFNQFMRLWYKKGNDWPASMIWSKPSSGTQAASEYPLERKHQGRLLNTHARPLNQGFCTNGQYHPCGQARSIMSVRVWVEYKTYGE
ncbi:MAG: hypothetical protein P8X86_14895 [Desulfofustis sp.]